MFINIDMQYRCYKKIKIMLNIYKIIVKNITMKKDTNNLNCSYIIHLFLIYRFKIENIHFRKHNMRILRI